MERRAFPATRAPISRCATCLSLAPRAAAAHPDWVGGNWPACRSDPAGRAVGRVCWRQGPRRGRRLAPDGGGDRDLACRHRALPDGDRAVRRHRRRRWRHRPRPGRGAGAKLRAAAAAGATWWMRRMPPGDLCYACPYPPGATARRLAASQAAPKVNAGGCRVIVRVFGGSVRPEVCLNSMDYCADFLVNRRPSAMRIPGSIDLSSSSCWWVPAGAGRPWRPR